MFEELVKIQKEVKIRQQRIYVLAILEIPAEVRSSTPQSELKKCQGTFLLSFSYFPHLGLAFPYEGHLWHINHYPLQFPQRYHSKQPKHSALIKPEWIGKYSTVDGALSSLLNWNTP